MQLPDLSLVLIALLFWATYAVLRRFLLKPLGAILAERERRVDDGPSENSSFHVIGTIFDTVYKEGHYLLRLGDASSGGSQALDLQPAQGGFVEFTFDEVGLYPFVTHKFASASKGALGIFESICRQRSSAEPPSPRFGSSHHADRSTRSPLERMIPPSFASKNWYGLFGFVTSACWSGCSPFGCSGSVPSYVMS